jgi:hypothetical protein
MSRTCRHIPEAAQAKRACRASERGRLVVVPSEREPGDSVDARVYPGAVVGSAQDNGLSAA